MSNEMNIFIATDNLIEIKELKDAETDSYINDATIKMALFEQELKHPDADEAAESENAGSKTKIKISKHNLTTDDFIYIEGSQNYDSDITADPAEYQIDSIPDADHIIIVAAYAAETFTGNENIYVAVRKGDAWPIELTHEESDDDGYYDGILPDTLKALTIYGSAESSIYYLFVEIVKGTSKRTERLKCKAIYPPG